MNAFSGPEGQEDMPFLLTVGPVTTSRAVKFAMLADYGWDDSMLRATTRVVRDTLVDIAGLSHSHSCVLLPGHALTAMEAALGSFCPSRRRKTLVIVNGALGRQAVQVLERQGKPVLKLEYRDTSLPRAADVEKTLLEDKSISHVWLAQVEASSGALNPADDIAAVVKAQGRVMMLDASLGFGAVSLESKADHVDVLTAVADCGLESVPGLCFVLARTGLLQAAQPGESPTLALDLAAEWTSQQQTGRFRFTPPTHALVALREALLALDREGGVTSRQRRYRALGQFLRERIKALGFSLLLPDADASAHVITVLAPRAATFDVERFRQGLLEKGIAISGGILQNRPSLRIGVMGEVNEKLLQHLLSAMESTIADMDVRSLAPTDP
jgi:2-aminoethylphosphonate-pyruvate transaminase